MLTGSHGEGDKELEANVKAAVGFQLLIPPDRAHWPRYITAQEVHDYPAGADRVSSARWCGAVRVFARGAEPLAGQHHGAEVLEVRTTDDIAAELMVDL
jgi:hypothetical protein